MDGPRLVTQLLLRNPNTGIAASGSCPSRQLVFPIQSLTKPSESVAIHANAFAERSIGLDKATVTVFRKEQNVR